MAENSPYPTIGDYALIADSYSAALVSRAGSIDWRCIQRVDSGSCFGRLVDWEKGGYCSISPKGEAEISRRYLEDTLVLETTFKTGGGEARLLDCLALTDGTEQYPYRRLLRVVKGVRGHVELDLEIVPRFDYGDLEPWIRQEGVNLYSAIGGNGGLIIYSDAGLAPARRYALEATVSPDCVYGVGGERRLSEETRDHLEGYRGARPVRVGNAAADQVQLDAYGELLELAWRWHLRGNSPEDDYWRFLLDLVDAAAECWREPDHGLWEERGDPQHFVHSKVMCWVAVDRGLRLSEECLRRAPTRRWRRVRDEIRASVEDKGYDGRRGTFVRAFGSEDVDAALLLLPKVGFVDYDDERMVRTTDAVREELDDDGLLKRFRKKDGREEGAFVACSFWLAECLVRQGRGEDARAIFDRAVSTGNDLGLFSEEYDTADNELLGNFPQGLSHLSHIAAAVALNERGGAPPGPVEALGGE